MPSTQSSKIVVAVDLDGTLAEYEKWEGVNRIGPPLRGAREFMEELHKTAHVVIFTTRLNSSLRGQEINASLGAVTLWLKENKIPYDDIYTGMGKLPYHCIVDDRAVPCPAQELGKAAYTEAMARVLMFKAKADREREKSGRTQPVKQEEKTPEKVPAKKGRKLSW